MTPNEENEMDIGTIHPHLAATGLMIGAAAIGMAIDKWGRGPKVKKSLEIIEHNEFFLVIDKKKKTFDLWDKGGELHLARFKREAV